MDTKVPLKLVYRDNVVRVSVDAVSLSVDVLQRLVLDAFGVQFVALKYTDPEGDLVSVVTDDDVHTALALFTKADGSFATVRVTAVPTARAVFQESVVEPVVKAMEHLVETLDAAKERVTHDERVQRAAAHTHAHLRGDVLQSAVADARESLCAVRDRIQEIPFEQLVQDASTGLKTAAASAAERAKEVVEDAKKEKLVQDAAEGLKCAAEGLRQFATDAVADAKADPTVQDLTAGIKTVAAGVSEVAMEAVDELKSKVAPYLVPAAAGAAVAPTPTPTPAPAPVATDADWEQVADAEDEIVQIVVAPEEQRWADALATIREIVPGVDTARAIAQLERAHGDVELALNALVEDM